MNHTEVVDLISLALAAEAATPGPWEAYRVSVQVGLTSYEHVTVALAGSTDRDDCIARCPHSNNNRNADAEFIVAASPDVVLALVRRIQRLEEALQKA